MPIIRMTYQFDSAYYVCVNKGENYIPKEIETKSLIIDDDIKEIVNIIKN